MYAIYDSSFYLIRKCVLLICIAIDVYLLTITLPASYAEKAVRICLAFVLQPREHKPLLEWQNIKNLLCTQRLNR